MENETIKSKHKTLKRLLAVVVLIALAFLAGIAGELFTRSYLSNFAFFKDLYFTSAENLGQRELVIRQPNKVVVQQDVMISQLIGNIQQSVLGLYYARPAAKNLADNLYLPGDQAGQAMVLTDDGWLITSSEAVNNLGNLIVFYKNKAYPIEKIVRDDATHAVFLKINVQNLPVVKLADLSQATLGEEVFCYDGYNQRVNLANIIDKFYKPILGKSDLIYSSQDFGSKILINSNLVPALSGSPIFNLSGEIIGIYDQTSGSINGTVIPINYLQTIINQVFKGEKIKRPYLGVYYLDLDKATIQNSLQASGAYIQSLASDSPLSGKLAKGDIILSVEGQDLDANNSLTDLLSSYKSGQEIKIKYQHLGKENEISVVLK